MIPFRDLVENVGEGICSGWYINKPFVTEDVDLASGLCLSTNGVCQIYPSRASSELIAEDFYGRNSKTRNGCVLKKRTIKGQERGKIPEVRTRGNAARKSTSLRFARASQALIV